MADDHDQKGRSSDADADDDGRPRADRESRQSVRPTAFGPPASRQQAAAEAEPTEPSQASQREDSSDSFDDIDTYELTPSNTQGALELISASVFADNPPSADTRPPSSGRQSVFPTLGYDPFRGIESQPAHGAEPDSEEGSVPFMDETEVTSPSLVAARSGLLPIPEGPESTPTPVPTEGVSTLAVALFALMVFGAIGILVAQWPDDDEHADAAPPPAALVVSARAAESHDDAHDEVRRVAAPPPLSPDSPASVLDKVQPSLPTEPTAAADKLHAYAQSYLEEGRPEVADVLLERALALDSRHLGVLKSLAVRALATGEPERAERYASQAAHLAPDDVEVRVIQGDAHKQLGQPARARHYYLRARKLAPDDPVVRARLTAP